jgi:predicted RNA binding protein YcfA (HicA-like mRNA interferase family)
MPSAPVLRPEQVVGVFERFGWRMARRHGGHIILVKSGHNATLSVPNHPEVARGTLRSLIRSADLTVAELIAAL